MDQKIRPKFFLLAIVPFTLRNHLSISQDVVFATQENHIVHFRHFSTHSCPSLEESKSLRGDE